MLYGKIFLFENVFQKKMYDCSVKLLNTNILYDETYFCCELFY